MAGKNRNSCYFPLVMNQKSNKLLRQIQYVMRLRAESRTHNLFRTEKFLRATTPYRWDLVAGSVMGICIHSGEAQ